MRLVHAVLLPGIIVFVSKVNVLQAHPLVSDTADVPASGEFDPNAEATVSGESRRFIDGFLTLASQKFLPRLCSTERLRTALQKHVEDLLKAARTGGEYASVAKRAEAWIAKHMKSLFRQWHRDAEEHLWLKSEYLEFFDSYYYKQMYGLVGNTNQFILTPYRISFRKVFMETFQNNKKMQQVVLGDPSLKGVNQVLTDRLESDYSRWY